MHRSGKISRCHWLGGVTAVNIKHKLTIWPRSNSSWKDPQEVSISASYSGRARCEFRADSSGSGPVGLPKLQWQSLPTPILYCSRGMSCIPSANLPTGTVVCRWFPLKPPLLQAEQALVYQTLLSGQVPPHDQFSGFPLNLFQLANTFFLYWLGSWKEKETQIWSIKCWTEGMITFLG